MIFLTSNSKGLLNFESEHNCMINNEQTHDINSNSILKLNYYTQ